MHTNSMRSNKLSRQNRGKQSNKAKLDSKELSEHPPQINGYQITHSQTLRFIMKNPVINKSITYDNILDTMLVATTATIGYKLFDLVKVKSVRVWGQAAVGTTTSVGVTFNTSTGDQEIHTDTSLGVRPCFVHAKPSAKSLASFYQTSSGGNCLTITAPDEAIIDIKVVFRTSPLTPQNATNPLVGATDGEFYYRGLDGLPIASTDFLPPKGVQQI